MRMKRLVAMITAASIALTGCGGGIGGKGTVSSDWEIKPVYGEKNDFDEAITEWHLYKDNKEILNKDTGTIGSIEDYWMDTYGREEKYDDYYEDGTPYTRSEYYYYFSYGIEDDEDDIWHNPYSDNKVLRREAAFFRKYSSYYEKKDDDDTEYYRVAGESIDGKDRLFFFHDYDSDYVACIYRMRIGSFMTKYKGNAVLHKNGNPYLSEKKKCNPNEVVNDLVSNIRKKMPLGKIFEKGTGDYETVDVFLSNGGSEIVTIIALNNDEALDGKNFVDEMRKGIKKSARIELVNAFHYSSK